MNRLIDCKGKISAAGIVLLVLLCVIIIFVFPTIVGYMSMSKHNNDTVAATKPVTYAISEEDYKAGCETIDYETLARNPDKYIGKSFKIKGEVIQVLESSYSDTVEMRINITKDEYGFWSDTIYAEVVIPSGSDRILEDDIIAIYGDCAGLYSYTSIVGSTVSLPKIDVKYYSIVNSD